MSKQSGFNKIGTGWNNVTKTGKKYVALRLDVNALNQLGQEGKAFLFKNDYRRNDKDPDYILMAPGAPRAVKEKPKQGALELEQPAGDPSKPYTNRAGDRLPF